MSTFYKDHGKLCLGIEEFAATFWKASLHSWQHANLVSYHDWEIRAGLPQ